MPADHAAITLKDEAASLRARRKGLLKSLAEAKERVSGIEYRLWVNAADLADVEAGLRRLAGEDDAPEAPGDVLPMKP